MAAADRSPRGEAGELIGVRIGDAEVRPVGVVMVMAVVVGGGVVAPLARGQPAAAGSAPLPVAQLEPATVRQAVVVVAAVRRVLKRNRRSTAARLARGALLKPLQQHLTLRARPRLLCVRIARLRLPLGQQRVGAAPTPKPDGVIGEDV